MSDSFKYFKNSSNEVFIKLENILFIPFGESYISKDKNVLNFETCYSDGVILKPNFPCAAINLLEKNPIRLKDIVKLLPDVDILPISNEKFKLSNPRNENEERGRVARKYVDYLIDIYIKNTGDYQHGKNGKTIIYKNKSRFTEEVFLATYVDLCVQQLKDAKDRFWSKEVKEEAKILWDKVCRGEIWDGDLSTLESCENDLKYGYYGYNQMGLNYPFNDGRVLFEMILPLHSARLSFPVKDIGNTIRTYRSPCSLSERTIDQCIIDDVELRPQWNLRQINRETVAFYEIDFLFWDGDQFIAIEIEGDHKKLSDYVTKDENIKKDISLKHITNSDLARLAAHFNIEASPDLDYRNQVLSPLFSQEILNFWQTVHSESYLRKLLNQKEFHCDTPFFDGSPEHAYDWREKQIEEIYSFIPWHFRYLDGYVYFEDPTE